MQIDVQLIKNAFASLAAISVPLFELKDQIKKH